MKFGGIRFTNNMKHIGKIIIVAVVALGASVWLWMYLNGYLTQSKASTSMARFSFVEKEREIKPEERQIVHADLQVSATSGMSAMDIAFTTTGTNLSFIYDRTAKALETTGFEMLLDEATGTLRRIVLISKRKASDLPKSVIIPLFFSVKNSGQAAKTVLTANISASQVVGGTDFTLEGENTSPITYTISVFDPRAVSVTNLECDIARNTSTSNCGRGVAVTWGKSQNADGYKVYKNKVLLKILTGKEVVSHNDQWCANYNPNTYSVIAFNATGSVSTELPTVSCACQICPTSPPPTPTPIMPTNSSDLIFRVVFPNAASHIASIPDVAIKVYDNAGKRICNDDTDCAKVVTFTRVPNSRVANTFRSPQLQYLLQKNQAYSITVVQNHTLKQTYKNIYLRWKDIIQCFEGTTDSGCGDLIEEVVTRPLYSGDLDKNNGIDLEDKTKVNDALGSQSAEGDLNFDGNTDQKDVEILGKNFNKKGT